MPGQPQPKHPGGQTEFRAPSVERDLDRGEESATEAAREGRRAEDRYEVMKKVQRYNNIHTGWSRSIATLIAYL